MGLFSRLLAGPFPADHDFWYSSWPGTVNTASGVAVTPDRALTISTVYACIGVIAETIATLPLHTYRRREDGGKDRAEYRRVSRLLQTQPNPWQTAAEFREMLTGHACLRGYGFAEIVPVLGEPVGWLMPLHPDRVRLQWTSGSSAPLYRVRRSMEEGGGEDILTDEQVLRVTGRFGGVSVIQYARESLGLAIAAREHGAELFGSGSTPTGVLEHKGKLSAEAKARLGADFDAKYAGRGKRKTVVIDEDMKWTQIGMTNEDAQFLETRQFQAIEVCQWFRMQPHKVGLLDRATFSNIEHQAIEHVTDTIRPWAVRWEQAIARDIIVDETIFAEHNLDGLLRGDIKTRYEAYAIGRNWGWLSANEIRARENLNPIESGDIYLQPLNMNEAGLPAGGGVEPGRASAQVRYLALEAARRVVRREQAAVLKAAQRNASDRDAFMAWAETFYGAHARFVRQALGISEEQAERYCAGHLADLKDRPLASAEGWEDDIDTLAAWAIGGEP